ncbi:hypothetical protein GGR54DRAFT_77445 [Hypoxylon sp. NC1633]|nr:hypothetical protein GGR54DRAFT_77445 [Hypoxylon sp. NC1633]
MVEVDIDAFLQRGYWPTSRARSPESRFYTSTNSPSLSYVHVTAPRALPPPPPSVEDEIESLAKEHGSGVATVHGEEPVNRGDPDQYPILLPVHEHNPERRFVLVSTPSDSTGDLSENVKKLPKRPRSKERKSQPDPEPTSYEANTGRKYESRTRYEEESEESEVKRDTRPNPEKHRIKPEHLPAIVTEVNPKSRSSDTGSKSKTRSDKGDDDYFSPRLSSRLQQGGTTLSPDVIEHASRGRDRAYYHGGTSPYAHDRNRSSHPNAQYEKNPQDDRRHKEKASRLGKSTSPTHHKRRSTADVPPQAKASSKVGQERPRQYAEPKSPRADRNGYARSERDTASQVSSNSAEKRESPPSEYFYSSDEEVPHQIRPRHRRESTVSNSNKAYLQNPAELKSGDRRRSRAPSPLPSPRVSQVHEKDSASSSPRSATFPKEIRFSRNEHRGQPPLSRTSTGKSVLNSSIQGAVPAIVATAATAATTAAAVKSVAPVDPRRSATAIPPPPPPRTGSVHSEARSSTSRLSSSPQRQARQPPEASLVREAASTEQPFAPLYKRYLDEVQAGKLPGTHRCPRRQPAAGHVDWLTLPRCDNFNICPSCYETTFSNTEFAHHFVPVPFRAADRPLACDFGTSQFYHIAYFLTGKYGKADLTLFRNIANVAARSQPCTGARETTRIWYSVKDPRSTHPIETFNVCYTCAKTVEVLLPNLTGLFVPMDSPAEPMRGVCAMHQQNERRFLFYFDLLEAASDKALAAKNTPDVQALADRIRDLTEVPECARDRPVHDSKWYTMRSIPDFTVCEECFGEVVWPMIQLDRSSLAANFHQHPQTLPLAACQLYSPRMRKIFETAVRESDIRYLGAKIRERKAKEQEFHSRIVGLDRQILGSTWVDAEVDRAVREWARWE